MKLRISNNSLRIRLLKSELAHLAAEGRVEERLPFPDGSHFSFSLSMPFGTRQIDARLTHENELEVVIPPALGKEWIETDQVGLEMLFTVPSGKTLHLLIEKDFPCAHQPMADRSDTFEDLAQQHKG